MSDPLMKPEDFATGFAEAAGDKPAAKAQPMQDYASDVPTVHWKAQWPFAMHIAPNPFGHRSSALVMVSWKSAHHPGFQSNMIFTTNFDGDYSLKKALRASLSGSDTTETTIFLGDTDPRFMYFLSFKIKQNSGIQRTVADHYEVGFRRHDSSRKRDSNSDMLDDRPIYIQVDEFNKLCSKLGIESRLS